MIKNLNNLALIEKLMINTLKKASSIQIPKDTVFYRGQDCNSIRGNSAFWSTAKDTAYAHAKKSLTDEYNQYLFSAKAKNNLQLYEFESLVFVITGTDDIHEFYNLNSDFDNACILLHSLVESGFFPKKIRM
jgi:hypothetical protein